MPRGHARGPRVAEARGLCARPEELSRGFAAPGGPAFVRSRESGGIYARDALGPPRWCPLASIGCRGLDADFRRGDRGFRVLG